MSTLKYPVGMRLWTKFLVFQTRTTKIMLTLTCPLKLINFYFLHSYAVSFGSLRDTTITAELWFSISKSAYFQNEALVSRKKAVLMSSWTFYCYKGRKTGNKKETARRAASNYRERLQEGTRTKIRIPWKEEGRGKSERKNVNDIQRMQRYMKISWRRCFSFLKEVILLVRHILSSWRRN